MLESIKPRSSNIAQDYYIIKHNPSKARCGGVALYIKKNITLSIGKILIFTKNRKHELGAPSKNTKTRISYLWENLILI